MGRTGKGEPQTPGEMPAVEPHELFPTTNIRHVITETGKLVERVDNLSRVVEKIPASVDAQGQKLFAAIDKLSADLKERANDIKADAKERANEVRTEVKDKVGELKTEMKEVRNSVVDLEKNLSYYRGALKILGLIFAIFVAITTVFAKYLIDKLP